MKSRVYSIAHLCVSFIAVVCLLFVPLSGELEHYSGIECLKHIDSSGGMMGVIGVLTLFCLVPLAVSLLSDCFRNTIAVRVTRVLAGIFVLIGSCFLLKAIDDYRDYYTGIIFFVILTVANLILSAILSIPQKTDDVTRTTNDSPSISSQSQPKGKSGSVIGFGLSLVSIFLLFAPIFPRLCASVFGVLFLPAAIVLTCILACILSAVLGLILSIKAIRQKKKRGLAIAGTIISIFALCLVLMYFAGIC